MSLTDTLSDNITVRNVQELRDAWIKHIKVELDYLRSISDQAKVHMKNVIKASHVLQDIYEMANRFLHQDKEYNMTRYTDHLLVNI